MGHERIDLLCAEEVGEQRVPEKQHVRERKLPDEKKPQPSPVSPSPSRFRIRMCHRINNQSIRKAKRGEKKTKSGVRASVCGAYRA